MSTPDPIQVLRDKKPTPQPHTMPEDREDQEDRELGEIECAKQTFLHSPPDSNNATKSSPSDSELSDLEDDIPEMETLAPIQDDIGDITPDHYSGTVPVFKPTMHQFKDFKLFMEKIDSYGMKSGIVKVIPPQEWKDAIPPYDNLVKQVRVREPIKQDIMGSNGTYRQVNILHQRSYNIPQWKQLCEQSEHQPPARRGERRANAERSRPAPRPRPDPSTKRAPQSAGKKKGRGRPSKSRGKQKDAQEAEEGQDQRPMTPVSPRLKDELEVSTETHALETPQSDQVPKVAPADSVMDSVEADAGLVEEPCEEPPVFRRMGAVRPSKTQSTSARRKYSRREGSAMIDEAAFKDFDYRIDVADYTPERCEELERTYWKTLTYAPPLYGADLMGTLFDESTEIWNLNKLPNLLDVLGTKVPGVNTAYLYLGMWKATFAWHLEDVDLYSINFLHFGAPKQWYSISQADARRFENAMKSIWPTDAKACDQFLRHKAFLISPTHLLQHFNIKVNKVVSYPGEFVITYPYGYHSGYNLGYNCAEAVNFALDSWLPMGKIAKKCECAQAQDSVWIDVHEVERKLRGEETEYEFTEDEEEYDEDEDPSGLPTPPAGHTVKSAGPVRKRKRPLLEKDGKSKIKKIRLRVKAKVEPLCCLCPNDFPGVEIIPTADGKKAHRICALYLPETYIDVVDGKEVVENISNIPRERHDLKCLYCRSKKGACFQCSQKKCTRAYHATCAAAAGVFVEEEDVPVWGEDGKEYKEQAFEFSCRFHRTKRDKKLDGQSLEEDKHIRAKAAALRKGDVCQIQYFKGDIFAGVVAENRQDEETLLLDIIPNGDRIEVEWKWLLLPDAADFHLQKASANALPLPTSRKAKEQLNAKRSEDEIPRKDAVFVEGFTWAEFNKGECDKNAAQARIDFSKDNQVWHYLGRTSTDTKAQYTDDPANPQHNPKSVYLDTVPKPPKPPKPTISTPRRASTGKGKTSPPSASPGVSPASVKQERPYVYKPRKPIDSIPNIAQPYANQRFAPHLPAIPSPLNQPYQPGPSSGHSPSIRNAQGSEPAQALEYPATHLSSNGSPPDTSNIGAQSGVWPPSYQATGLHYMPPAPFQSPTPAPPQLDPLAVAGQPADQQYQILSLTQQYPYFQTHHNRDPSLHRTPYASWGGFTNGYEGDLRTHLMNNPAALFASQNHHGGFGSNTPLHLMSSGSSSLPGQAQFHPGYYASSTEPTEGGNEQTPQSHVPVQVRPKSGPGTPTNLNSQHRPQPSSAANSRDLSTTTPAARTPTQSPATQSSGATPKPIEMVPVASQGALPTKTRYKAPLVRESPVPLPAKYLAAMTGPATTPTSSSVSPMPGTPASSASRAIPEPQPPTPISQPSENPTIRPVDGPRISEHFVPLPHNPPISSGPPPSTAISERAEHPGVAETAGFQQAYDPAIHFDTATGATDTGDVEFPDVPEDSMGLIEKMLRNLRKASEKDWE